MHKVLDAALPAALVPWWLTTTAATLAVAVPALALDALTRHLPHLPRLPHTHTHTLFPDYIGETILLNMVDKLEQLG